MPTAVHRAYHADYGPRFATEGVVTVEPPKIGTAFPILVPQVDADGNGLNDDWEVQHFGFMGVDPNADPDGDGFSNFEEQQAGTDPKVGEHAIGLQLKQIFAIEVLSALQRATRQADRRERQRPSGDRNHGSDGCSGCSRSGAVPLPRSRDRLPRPRAGRRMPRPGWA